jgi:hypothetical protein
MRFDSRQGQKISLSSKASILFWAHTSSSPKDNKLIILRVRRPECETDHLPLSIIDVKKSGAVNVLQQDDLIAFTGLYFKDLQNLRLLNKPRACLLEGYKDYRQSF